MLLKRQAFNSTILFTQICVICAFRWVKFEEDVEDGSNRWSKPHVATLSLHSLFELRNLLTKGTILLDMEATKYVSKS